MHVCIKQVILLRGKWLRSFMPAFSSYIPSSQRTMFWTS